MNKIKALFFITDLGGGGAERGMINLLHRLDPNKYDITVHTIFDYGVHKENLPSYVKYRSSSKRRFRGFVHLTSLFSPKFLFRHFIKDRYDLIVSYLEGLPTRIVSGNTDKHTKIISILQLEAKKRSKYLKPYRSLNEMERTYNKFDYVCAVSETALESLKDKINLTVPSCVINNIIETGKIIEQSNVPVTEISVPENEMILGSVGRLDYQKAYPRMLKVLHRLKSENHKFKYYILGVGPQQALVEKDIEKYNLQDTVHLLGFHSNPYKFMKLFDLFVCCSYFEGFSTVVCESVIAGTPVLATLCSGMEEILGHNNEYGIIVENNEEGLYQGLKNVLDHPESLIQYREKVKERSKGFTPEKLGKELDDLFQTTLKK